MPCPDDLRCKYLTDLLMTEFNEDAIVNRRREMDDTLQRWQVLLNLRQNPRHIIAFRDIRAQG